ncbi:hypothetical protein [Robbsia andropogonis]|uniref:hypothetical protein n=1 Tax=Robbsia andropogonis TaxID=28092 RepID=UPI0004632BAF|nr:hypothetical protein [Robbsia andropogonis]
MIAKNNVMEWQRVACTPGSMLQNVEIRRAKGLLNLTGSSDFAIGTRSQTQKRDLQRTVAAVIMAYNEVAAEAGAPLITIHENHVKGDGKVYEDRKIPRASNERDYDYYHTLGVNYADNGRMLPHYHLEFGKALNKQNVGAVLWNLHRIGRDVLGGEILHPNDIANILNKLPEGQILPGLDAQKVGERRQLLPNELATPKDRANSRDTLESAFIALSSANTEIASKHPSLRNAHMNSFRIAEPMFECFSSGHTALIDDLQRIENASIHGDGLGVSDLMSIHQGLKKAMAELGDFSGGTAQERDALAVRLNAATGKIKRLLKTTSVPLRREQSH